MTTKRKQLTQELVTVLNREKRLIEKEASEFGIRIYNNTSIQCASDKQILNDDFLIHYVNYYLNDYAPSFLSNNEIPDNYIEKHALLQAQGILNSRLKLFLTKIPTTQKEIHDRCKIGRALFRNKDFQNAIAQTRKVCGLPINPKNNLGCSDVDDAIDFIIGQMIDIDENFEVLDDDNDFRQHFLEKIYMFANKILDDFHLENGWINYIISLIASPNSFPKANFFCFANNDGSLASILGITDSTITIQLGRGISQQKFEAIYKALAPILQMEPVPSMLFDTMRQAKTRIYFDHLNGMTNKEIARAYLNYDKDDKMSVTERNTISHIINREEKNRKSIVQ